ncbi:hypothetical protein [Streptomyces sp. NPDC056132]|uniref:hypothetical protein n=1 Tax=Streptomyces sp. NPDC056132 TaxID=3345722 RepID=UPI0035D79B59
MNNRPMRELLGSVEAVAPIAQLNPDLPAPGTEFAANLYDEVADPEAWSLRVCAHRCSTCIFRAGNLMNLAPGRVAGMVKKAVEVEGHVVCHKTLGTDTPAICEGFASHPQGRVASLALRLARASVLEIVAVQPDREGTS